MRASGKRVKAQSIVLLPVAFEVAWLLAALSQPNHIVPLCSGASFACRLHASSIPLGICDWLEREQPTPTQFQRRGVYREFSSCFQSFSAAISDSRRNGMGMNFSGMRLFRTSLNFTVFYYAENGNIYTIIIIFIFFIFFLNVI